jgi:CBS domain containing-hemolysin-like protein
MDPWITITIISLALSALFSGTEIAFITGDRVRVEIDAKRGGIVGRIINRFYSNTEFFISSILVGNNITLVIYGMGAAALIEPWLKDLFHSEALVLLCQTIISTLIILLCGEFIPKTVFRVNPNSSLRVFALPVYLFYIILYPISWFVVNVSRKLMKWAGIKANDKPYGMLSVGDLNDYLEETIDNLSDKKEPVEHEVKIFQNALDFSSTHLRDCMLPRNEIVAVNFDTVTRDELSELFTQTGRSKIVVFKEDIDNILGYIHVSELFDPANDWHLHINPVLYAPETLLANKMMRRLLSEKRSMAIVVDEFGGTAGLVTLEDLVEEIFGDIEDEHDKALLTARRVAPDTYEFSGRCEIAEINERFDLDIPESDDYQTIAGYVLSSTGTIPDLGQTIHLGDYTIDILKKSANRLELLKLTHTPAHPAE